MKPAVVIVDMLEDNYGDRSDKKREEERIVRPVRDFLRVCRSLSVPVIFACDSFLEGDFIFGGRMKPHAIRGTAGARVLDDLEPQPSDIVLPKRRFSAFFKTDLDQTLRTWNIDTVAVGGIATYFCVLATAFDAVCHDFHTVILEDLCAAYKKEIHDNALSAYRHSAIHPLLRVATSSEFIGQLRGVPGGQGDSLGSGEWHATGHGNALRSR
ncbi:MAG: Peroxyureidoacrylate/ureidoacrylate amidohydrolase RutB [Syntrophorhabdaceae bacterium PtaU1.Bin034]|nr:MAG: Peroxyureidoacrylate/ureidoacrylate amidohydrolase RutB [Syntrophorhabdaceae bacterium PtaU1.Bin034]